MGGYRGVKHVEHGGAGAGQRTGIYMYVSTIVCHARDETAGTITILFAHKCS